MNPRVSFLIVITLILFSCGTEVKEAPPELVSTKTLVSETDTFYGGGNLLFVTDTTEAVFNSYYTFKRDTCEKNNIKKDNGFVSRIGDTLFLKLNNGSLKKLVSDKNMETDDFTAYDYIGKINSINSYVLFVSYYEAFQYLVVNAKTGKETYMCGVPAIAPNKKYLVSSCCDLQAGFVFNGLEMYDVESDSLKLNWNRELHKWGADEVVWVDDHNFVVKKQYLDSLQQNQLSSYIKISCGGK